MESRLQIRVVDNTDILYYLLDSDTTNVAAGIDRLNGESLVKGLGHRLAGRTLLYLKSRGIDSVHKLGGRKLSPYAICKKCNSLLSSTSTERITMPAYVLIQRDVMYSLVMHPLAPVIV